MKLTTRPAPESDTGFAREVHHCAYREVVERQFGPWVEEQQDRYFEGDWTTSAFEIVFVGWYRVRLRLHRGPG